MFRSLDHPQGATLFLAKVILKTFTFSKEQRSSQGMI